MMEDTPWKIVWSDALSMNNAEIDAHHQHFIALVNELNGAIIDRKDKADIGRIMQAVLEDAAEDFAYEEQSFVETMFPLAQAHRERHVELLESLGNSMNDFHQTDINLKLIEIALGFKNALVEHVLKDDCQYAEYLRTR